MNRIAIIGGCGHVGIPLGLALASKGFQTTLIDKNTAAVECILGGKLPFHEEGAEQILAETLGKTLHVTTDSAAARECDAMIFVIGTPVDEHLNPCVNAVMHTISDYIPLMSDGQLIILRSTLYPGTFRIIENMLLNAGKRPRLAFCPERIQQGKGIQEIFSLPQIISGATPEALEAAREVFSRLTDTLIEATPEEAELAKLMTNSWRYLEFAIANQFYIMAQSSGIDFHRLYDIMTTDYPRARHFAKPGLAAGPCLLKDTLQLASFYNNNFFLGHSAMLVNEGLPNFLVEELEKKLGSLNGRKIAIFGMTFKVDSDDIRDSLSFKIKKKLEQKLAVVLPVDPYLEGMVSIDDALATADGIILGAPHTAFKDIRPTVPFIDCWRLWK